MTKVRGTDRVNKAMVREAAGAVEGLSLPIDPSHSNFFVLETVAAGVRPEALVECYRRQGIMIRQGTYHTQRFGDRFVKVSTSVPSLWVEKFCALLPEMGHRHASSTICRRNSERSNQCRSTPGMA
jgi:histidinol-phosphate/aromatic aminotransferase/cobyric acid decarboxylase-like protein